MNPEYRTHDVRHGSPDPSSLDAGRAPPKWIGRYRVREPLGEGGFGLVYLAHDEQLDRLVAIKVPRRALIAKREDAAAYLAEARTVARLDHPNIVPVYDVGSTDEFPYFIVSRFIEGTTLAAANQRERLGHLVITRLVATIADALHYAHSKGLVHRDIKPSNILIDPTGKPYVADFGMALREENVGQGPKFAGTPAYMSPEQARGEGHRVDGRSDIFSLGIIYYELLTGRRPFPGESETEVLEQIVGFEPRPPRQLDDRLPKELERICLKAIAKRGSERYTTAKDLAEDMRQFLAGQPGELHYSQTFTDSTPTIRTGPPMGGSPGPMATPATPTLPSHTPALPAAPTYFTPVSSPPGSTTQPIRIVPKGLRSFDEHDADFFLELLPGPRDRDGLPDSLRFWKTRMEEMDPDHTFAVGLIYGPSGCGKSSLVRAGLVPRLSGAVRAVYVEATAAETEARLLAMLRKRCPGVPVNLGMKDTLACLRRGQGVPLGQKTVIILDQFEQWLHAHRDVENSELVQALRQCDGGRVQCLVMVRDDFWMVATRFMRELEIRLVEGQNSAAVDLFPIRHAERVLAAFGTAFGAWPDEAAAGGKERRQFLEQAVAGLAQEGKVVCVRLALFAEMMKGRPWTPAGLKAVGGAEGVGFTFLEETFSAAAAPPEHRYHQKAARAVLRALLPESSANIKGHMRARAELLAASGYGNRPRDFEDLVRILDSEIRLITPTDPEGVEGGGWPVAGEEGRGQTPATHHPPPATRFYQLTHDYLIPSLREWLTRKQKESRRGRAELLLNDRAAVWNARQENRQLPSLLQWLGIRALTRQQLWSEPERRMMRHAARYHALSALVVAGGLALVAFVCWQAYARLKAETLRDRLLEATTADVPAIVREMAPYRSLINPLLAAARGSESDTADARKQLHASLALLPADPGQVPYLYSRLLKARPHELLVIREALEPHQRELTGGLWVLLEDPKNDQDERFHAAAALARFDPDSARWEKVKGDVASILIIQKPFLISPWTEALQPVGKFLMPPLAGFLEDEKRTGGEIGIIASVYGSYSSKNPAAYLRLEERLSEKAEAAARLDARVALARRQANIAVALLLMGRTDKVWPLLAQQADPSLRSLVIERLGPAGVGSSALSAQLDKEKDVGVKRAILLGLGEFGLDRLMQAERHNLVPRLAQLHEDPDPGLHGAAAWLLRAWQAADKLPIPGKDSTPARRWHVNRLGMTMVTVPGPGEVWVSDGAERRKVHIARTYAIASTEVTVAQFRALGQRDSFDKRDPPAPASPATNISWYDAVEFCNLLSKHENIPEEEWCYIPNKDGKYDDGMKTAPDFLRRRGYRLPTEAEWEAACRAGTASGYSFGDAEELIDKYAWHQRNAHGRSHPTGLLKPNDLGLFDMHGNAYEWCQGREKAIEPGKTAADQEDAADARAITDKDRRIRRGGSFDSQAVDARSALPSYEVPSFRVKDIGFRVARTISP